MVITVVTEGVEQQTHTCMNVWKAVFTFNPYLLISRIHLFISINQFLISINKH